MAQQRVTKRQKDISRLIRDRGKSVKPKPGRPVKKKQRKDDAR